MTTKACKLHGFELPRSAGAGELHGFELPMGTKARKNAYIFTHRGAGATQERKHCKLHGFTRILLPKATKST